MTSIPHEPKFVNDRLTWQSLFFGAAVWFLHLNVVYPLTSLTCHWGWFSFTVAGIPGLHVIQLIATAAAALLLGIFIYLPWRNWRQFQREPRGTMGETAADRRPLIAYLTMLLNALFLLFVLVSVVPVLALEPCAPGGG